MKVRFGLAALLVALGACGSDLTRSSPVVDPSDLANVYWSLTLDHQAARMSTTAPYDTLTLHATARNSRGEPIVTDQKPVFISGSPDRLHVDENGVIHARLPGGAVVVKCVLTIGGVTHRDSLYVDILDEPNPKVLSTFSIQIPPPDSAKIARDNLTLRTIPVVALDADNQPMPVTVAFSSSDSTMLKVDRFTGVVNKPTFLGPSGTVYITAKTTSFGVSKTDVLEYRIGLPLAPTIRIARRETLGGYEYAFEPSEVMGGVGAEIGWGYTGDAIPGLSVVFEDPSQALAPLSCFSGDCGSGNPVSPLPPAFFFPFTMSAKRRFSAPGVYKFHSPSHNMRGQIVILAE